MSRTPLALVINPYAADFKLYDEWMHPLGLYFLIDLLRHNGFEVRFFNCLERTIHERSKKFSTGEFHNEEIEKPSLFSAIPRKFKRYGRPLQDLTDFLEAAQRPDLICIGSMMTYWLPGVTYTADTIVSRFPDVPIVIGGCAARLIPETMAAYMPQHITISTSMIESGSIVLHPSLPPLSPKTPLSLRPGLEMLPRPVHGPLLASLGCPMRCSFCASSYLQGAFRRRDPSLILDEINCRIAGNTITDFAFFDDALLYEPERGVVPLCNTLIDRKYNIRLHAPNGLHLRGIDEILAILMKRCGFRTLRFGYESGAACHTRDISRKTTRDDMVRKISFLLKAGFDGADIGIYVMAGLPDQTPDHVLQEIDFIQGCGIKAKPVFLSPVPGTRLFDYWARQFPRLRTDPLWHNDHFFITQLPGWSYEAMEMIREKARS